MIDTSRLFSISNIAWSGSLTASRVAALRCAGLSAVEIAPTSIWPNLRNLDPRDAKEFGVELRRQGLSVSGVQSLLFGQPDLQLLDPKTWPALQEHLERMLEIAHALGAKIAVFGSPKNRVRNSLSAECALDRAAEFLAKLETRLCAFEVTLTLEPNAPEYGADFLTTYEEVVALATKLDSCWVRPQIDIGCLEMVGQNVVASLASCIPAHVHVSAPNLQPPPGRTDHNLFAHALHESGYAGWRVLEMLPTRNSPFENALERAKWMVATYSGAE